MCLESAIPSDWSRWKHQAEAVLMQGRTILKSHLSPPQFPMEKTQASPNPISFAPLQILNQGYSPEYLLQTNCLTVCFPGTSYDTWSKPGVPFVTGSGCDREWSHDSTQVNKNKESCSGIFLEFFLALERTMEKMASLWTRPEQGFLSLQSRLIYFDPKDNQHWSKVYTVIRRLRWKEPSPDESESPDQHTLKATPFSDLSLDEPVQIFTISSSLMLSFLFVSAICSQNAWLI